MLCYLAGSISEYQRRGELEKAIQWRVEAKEALRYIGIKVFDPTINYETNKLFSNKSKVHENNYYLEKSNIMLLNLEYLNFSPSSLFALFRFWDNHKPVIAFGKNEIIYNPEVEDSISIVFPYMDKALEYIQKSYAI